MRSLTEAIRRLEANARDSAPLDDPSSRSLQHSLSCGTIIVDPRTADAAAANANTRGFLATVILCACVCVCLQLLFTSDRIQEFTDARVPLSAVKFGPFFKSSNTHFP